MEIIRETRDDVVICYLKGDIDIDNSSKLKEVLEEIVKGKNRKVLLNFKEVEYIDSLGIATLIEFSKKLSRKEGVLFFCELSPNLSSLFGITKIDRIFKVYETQKEALKEFNGY